MRQPLSSQPPRFASLDDAPVLLTIDELAEIYRCSAHTIRHRLQAGTFSPEPVAKRPYRWRKVDVEDDIKRLFLREERKPRRARRRTQ